MVFDRATLDLMTYDRIAVGSDIGLHRTNDRADIMSRQSDTRPHDKNYYQVNYFGIPLKYCGIVL